MPRRVEEPPPRPDRALARKQAAASGGCTECVPGHGDGAAHRAVGLRGAWVGRRPWRCRPVRSATPAPTSRLAHRARAPAAAGDGPSAAWCASRLRVEGSSSTRPDADPRTARGRPCPRREPAPQGSAAGGHGRAAPRARGRPWRSRRLDAPRAAAEDPFTGELRRREVLPLLVLHFIARGAHLRQPADGADRRHDRGRAVGEPEHDVPAAAPARVARADRGQLGAPRAAHPPLLLDHRRGREEYERLWTRCGRSSTRCARASTRSCARCTADEDASARRGRVVPLEPEASRSRSGPTVSRWPAFVEGFARIGRARRRLAGRRARRLVWESSPGGRGRVTERVLERAEPRGSRPRSSRRRSAGTPDRRVARARRAAARSCRLQLDYELDRAAGRSAGSPTASSSAAPCATRCAARSRRFAVEAEEEAGLR